MAYIVCESPSPQNPEESDEPDYDNLVEKLVEHLQEYPAIWSGRSTSTRSRAITHAEILQSWESLADVLGVSVQSARRLYDTLRRRFREVGAVLLWSIAMHYYKNL